MAIQDGDSRWHSSQVILSLGHCLSVRIQLFHRDASLDIWVVIPSLLDGSFIHSIYMLLLLCLCISVETYWIIYIVILYLG